MFSLELPHLILIPPPWDLLMSGLLPFFIVAMLLPNDFMMPKNDDGDFHGGDERADRKADFHWSEYRGEGNKPKRPD